MLINRKRIWPTNHIRNEYSVFVFAFGVVGGFCK